MVYNYPNGFIKKIKKILKTTSVICYSKDSRQLQNGSHSSGTAIAAGLSGSTLVPLMDQLAMLMLKTLGSSHKILSPLVITNIVQYTVVYA